MTSNTTFIARVAADCLDDAKRSGTSVRDAVWEWEGDGPDGSFGLRTEEVYKVVQKLVDDGHDLDEVQTKGQQS